MTTKSEKSILILEDEETIRTVLAEALKKAGYKTFPYQSADASCVNTLVNEKIDLILLDLGLFHFDAVQILKFLRAQKVAKGIPVIVVSGKSVKEIERSAKELKAKDWVAKPFKIQEVLEKVKQALEG